MNLNKETIYEYLKSMDEFTNTDIIFAIRLVIAYLSSISIENIDDLMNNVKDTIDLNVKCFEAEFPNENSDKIKIINQSILDVLYLFKMKKEKGWEIS